MVAAAAVKPTTPTDRIATHLGVTVDQLHESGHGIAYTTSPFAHLFTRLSSATTRFAGLLSGVPTLAAQQDPGFRR